MRVYAIIPARYNSKRFPGKPLALINGQPMFKWVHDACQACELVDKTIITTDDARIYDAAKSCGCDVCLTGPAKSGTDRVYECAINRGLSAEDIVINVQGDEPLILPEHISSIVKHMADNPRCRISTIATIVDYQHSLSPNVVKVVLDHCNRALYFSRQAIPHNSIKYHKHIGVYAFRMAALALFCNLTPGPLELSENLEQLRALEHGISIDVVLTPHDTIGVDTPEDIDRVCKHLAKITN